jgi:hypothetical protein
MRKILFFLLTLSALSLQGFSQPLSPAARISLLVCAPGDEIYSYFGHAAIRVNDPLTGLDTVFHYGAFSFETPHFIWRFAKGETDYEIAKQRMSSFMQEFYEEKRSVKEYILDFSPQEKQFLFDVLVENNKPENRVYRYNHFLDNCATRLRDQIEKTVKGQIRYDTSAEERLSFRNLIDRYVEGNTWSGLGIKLALGNPTDRITTFSEKMFLPDYLGNDMSKAVITRDGHQSPLILGSSMIIQAPLPNTSFSFTSPVVVILFFFLLTAGLTIREIKEKKRFFWLDVTIFAAFGIAALILYFTTFISVMTWTKWNLNLIWAWPTHLLVAVLWLFPSMRPKLTWYMQFTSVVLILFLISMFFLPQTFHWLVVPICLMLLLRTGTYRNIGIKSANTNHSSTIL